MQKAGPSVASVMSPEERRRKVSSARTAKNGGGSASSSESSLVLESNIQRLDLLKELQAEIQNLKYENHELKFYLYVTLKNGQEAHKKDQFSLEMANMAREYLDESSNLKNIQLELETVTSMLEEARWVQNHYETRVREQELKIDGLQKELMQVKSRELSLLQLQLPSGEYSTSRTSRRVGHEAQECRARRSGRQRSLSTNGQNRKGSLLNSTSYLPDDYKDTVATLPPIIDPRRQQSHKTQVWAQINRVT